jgi:hypothetical protein
MNVTRTRACLLLVASCLLLAACGPAKSTTGGSPAATATTGATAGATSTAAAGGGKGSGLTACDLITKDDASAAIGKTIGAGTPGGTAALSECIYDDGGLIVGMKTDSLGFYNTSHDSAVSKGATDVPGVGDSAFASGTANNCAMLFVKGTSVVSIIVSESGARTIAVTVAKVAASKL